MPQIPQHSMVYHCVTGFIKKKGNVHLYLGKTQQCYMDFLLIYFNKL